MHACKPSVEGALKKISGVYRFQVEIPPKDHAWVIFDPQKATIDDMKSAIEKAGYHVQDVIPDYRPE